MKAPLLFATVLALAMGCGGPQTVSATGAMTALLNQSLARTTAQNRALADAQALATVGGIGFTFSKSSLGQHLDLEQPESSLPIVNSEFSPVPNGWLATVYVERSEEVAKQMSQLETVAVEASAKGENLPAAMRDAKLAALEALLRQSLGELPSGITTGAITLTDLRYRWPENLDTEEIEVTISLTGHVRVEQTKQLSEDDALQIALRLVTEQTKAGLWSEALGAVDGFLSEYPRNRRFGVLRVGIQLKLNDFENAKSSVKTAFRRCDWDQAQEALAQVEPFLGVETADEIQAIAVDAGLIAPPSVGRGPPPSTAVVEDEASDSAPTTPPKKKKKKRRRKKRR